MDRSKVILVNEQDQPLGNADKMEAHLSGQLHRAISIFIFNNRGEMLLQQRALEKYHSGGLWTNACCSHPLEEMSLLDFGRLRLREELGFETKLEKIFDFIYRAEMGNGLIEHELDHVLLGVYDGMVPFDSKEVMDYRFSDLESIEASLISNPEKYTAWFLLAFPKVKAWFEKNATGSSIS